jgi:fibronectin type 3 domain-containing protein
MNDARIRRRGAFLLAILALGLWTVIFIARASRETRRPESGADQARGREQDGPANSIKGLRLERLGEASTFSRRAGEAPRAARMESSGRAVAVLPAKERALLVDSPAAHETAKSDVRAPGKMHGEILLSREGVLKERDGLYGYGSAAYGATVGKGTAEFARPLNLKSVGQPRLSWNLTEIRAGKTVLAQGGDAPARAKPEERTVSFDRGAVEERYFLRPDALEQSFVIRSLPGGAGDITVSGRITTNLEPPAEGSSGPRLAFTSQGHEVLWVSEAVALDAAGNRQELALSYSSGVVSMTVPASWVAGATLPITVDPLMGGPVVIDPSIAATVGQVNGVPVRITDVCYNQTQNEFFVVWNEQFGASAFAFDVYAQRVSATGNLIGSEIAISPSGDGEYEPAVSWASSVNRYLVAWRDDPADNASDADQFIAGRVLNPDGTFFTPAFVLDDVTGQDFGPSLAFDGTNWFCVFTNVVSSTDTNVIGRFVATDGSPGTVVSLDTDTDLAAAPAVDVAGGTYLVAWQKGPPGGPMSIAARTMNTSGTLSAVKIVDQTTADCRAPDVSADGTQFLVVWQQAASPTDHNVVGRRVASSLAFNGNAINIRTSTADQLTPRARWSATNSFWYVVYSDTTNGDADIYGNRVGQTGQVFGANRLTSASVDEVKPVLAWNSATDEMLVCYLYGAASPFQIRAQRVSMDFVVPSIPGVPVASPNPSPTGTFTLTWTASTDQGGSGFSNYDLQRSANGGVTWATIASPTTESFTDTMPFGEYFYRVRAEDNAGNLSAFSPLSATVTVDNLPPPEPLALGQFRTDGVTPIPPGGTTVDTGVVLGATVNSLGLLDGFEDGNFTIDPMWTVGAGSWAISADGNKVLHDGAALDDQIYTPSNQTSGSWEYRFRWPAIATGTTVNLQAGFYLFLGSAGLGGNGYEILATAGAASTKSVSLYRVDGASHTQLVGTSGNWTPDTNFHVVRVNRSSTGRFDLILDGVLLGSAVDTTYSAAVSTLIRHQTSNTNTLHVDYVRMSSALVARPAVKLQVEVKPLGTPFDGTGLLEGALAPSGSTVTVPVPSLGLGGYVWRARTADALGNVSPFTAFGSGASADFTRIPATPPPPPSSLSATPGNAQVALAWGASSGATSYTVKRSTTHGTGYSSIASVTALSFTDTGVQNGTTYYYVVTATGAGGESAPSNEASATPQGPPTAPTGLTATAGDTQVVLSWTASPTASTYVVQRSLQSGTGYVTVATAVVPTSYTDGAVTNNTTYYYVILAVNSAGTSGPSNEASATPLPPPAAPANFAGVALSSGQIQWSWSAVPGATGYLLQDDANNTIATNPATLTTITEAGLQENTAYSRHVRAVRGTAASAASNTAVRYTLVHDASPADFVLSRPTYGEVDVSIIAPPGGTAKSTGVQIERSADGISFVVVKPFSPVYVFHDLGVSPTGTLFYRIRFQNADGQASQVSAAQAAPAAQPPAAPTNFTGTLTLPSSVQWKWDAGSDNTGYEVRDAGQAIVGTTGPGVNAYFETGLAENVQLSRHVDATSPAGPSAPSNTVLMYTRIHDAILSDFNLAAVGPSQAQITVVSPPGAGNGQTGCEIQRLIAGTWVVVKAMSNSFSLLDTGLAEGSSPQYRIRFQNGDGVSSQTSPTKSVTLQPGALGTPAGFQGAAQSVSSILWSWSETSGEAGFVVRNDADGTVGTVGTGILNFAEPGLLENTSYRRHVVAAAGTLFSPPSNVDAKYTLVHVPVIAEFTVATAGMSAVNFSVTPPPNPTLSGTGVRIERSTDGITWITAANLIGIYQLSDTGLRGGITYQYRIRFLNGDGVPSAPSPVQSASTPPATVAAVAGLTATGGGAQVSLQWTANTEPVLAGYSVYRSTTSGGPYAKQNGALVTGTSFADTNVRTFPQTTYYYVVRAVDTSAQEGANSNEASATPLPLPGAPFVVFSAGRSATSIVVEVQPNDFSSSGNFLLQDSNNQLTASSGIVPVFPESVFDITESGLSENTAYTRHAREVTTAGTSPPSADVQVWTLVHDATASDFALSAASGTSVSVSVTPPPNGTQGQTGVFIFRSSDNLNFQLAASLTGTYQFTDLGLQARTTYYYKVEFVNGQGSGGALSPAKSILLPLPPPGAFTGVAVSTTSVQWSWGALSGAAGYRLADTTGTLIASTGPSTLTFTETALSENVAYARQVQAFDAVSPSPFSTPVLRYSLVHDPGTADFSVQTLSATRVQITVVPPPSAIAGETGVQIQRFDGTAWTLVSAFSTAYTFVDTGLVAGTPYSYTIQFRNGDGVPTAVSAAQSTTTGPPPPPAPTGFAGVAQSPFSILWYWNNVPGSGGFLLQNDAGNVIASIPSGVLSYVETGLGENSRASRHVSATNPGGPSVPSASVARYTLVHDAMAGDLALTAAAGDLVDIQVAPPQGATADMTGCVIERSADGQTWTVVKPFSSVYAMRDSGLSRSTQYFYRTRFENGDGVLGLYSPAQAVTTLSFSLPVITTAPKKTRNPNTLVQGTADPGVLVTVYFSSLADGSVTAAGDGTWSYHAATKAEGTYTVSARAGSGASQSASSNAISITIDLTAPAPPSNVRTTAYNNAVDITWDSSPSSDVAGYLVYRRTGTGAWTALNASQLIGGTQFRDSSAANGQRYTYKVLAVDDATND